MELPELTSGRIIRRYKRFLADIVLDDGREVVAHCPNTGAMTGCWAPDAVVQVSFSDNPKRKLAWTLERVDMGHGWIGVHTGRTNPVVGEGLRTGSLDMLTAYQTLQAEVVLNEPGHPKSRIDFKLSDGDRADAWVEVKNATLLDGERIRFPDAVTARGKKHLDLLAAMVGKGLRGVLIFAVNRPEGEVFSPAELIDPAYSKRLREVVNLGVEVVAVRIVHGPQKMTLGELIPVEL